ncbi:hypothetical protein OI69_13920 [Pectobacterium fontis]|uniref:Uncharacterized protein n=1 Tax=Pectobacterium fontis TaxID=2558042 RepID=A0A7V8IHK5_9GAMM|nr:hypothetical protein OI69_13920 [Pectobacterium fontis]
MWRYLVNVRPALAGWRWISLVARYYVNIFGDRNKGKLCHTPAKWPKNQPIQYFCYTVFYPDATTCNDVHF